MRRVGILGNKERNMRLGVVRSLATRAFNFRFREGIATLVHTPKQLSLKSSRVVDVEYRHHSGEPRPAISSGDVSREFQDKTGQSRMLADE